MYLKSTALWATFRTCDLALNLDEPFSNVSMYSNHTSHIPYERVCSWVTYQPTIDSNLYCQF